MALQDVSGVKAIVDLLGVTPAVGLTILVVISVWTLVWKGLALWKSSKKNQPTWFIVLLVLNTVGILEILYIYVFSKMGKRRSAHKKR